jgi:hypothetical protein
LAYEGLIRFAKVSTFKKKYPSLKSSLVLIMSKASFEEWRVIVGLLKTFLNTSRLKINFEKSTFHVVGLDDTGLAPFKELFPYSFVSLDVAFKYLGFFLKP